MNNLFSNRKKATIAIALIAIIAVSSGIFLQNNQTTQAALINPQSPGLVGWWNFDEGSGTVAGDSSGDNDGTLVGVPLWVDGRYGSGLSFSGSSYVDVGSSAVFNPTSISISAWINPNRLGVFQGIVGKYSDDNNRYELYINSQNHIKFLVGNGFKYSIADSNIVVQTGTWYHVVGTFDGSQIKVYVDGIEKDSVTLQGSVSSGNSILYIGRTQSANFNGIIDDVRFYNKSLSTTEIQSAFNGGLYGPTSVIAKVPQGTIQVIVTLSWQGTTNINAIITSPSQTYTESTIPVYQKTTYSTSDDTSSMLNIKRLSISVNTLSSNENWNIALTFDNPVPYKITVEVQK